MKTIAVTGATGFVGRHLVTALAKEGYSVVAFGRRNLNGHMYWDITEGPLQNPPQVDAIVHCAAHVDDWAGYAESHKGNVLGTKNVLQSFPNTPLFIHVSSASVYDPFVTARVLTEESPCGNFLNAYSKTKREAELLVSAAPNKYRIILRPHIIYGPGDTTVLPRILAARRFGRFMVVGDGKNKISVTYVENLVHAVSQALKSKLTDGCEIFNVADESQDTVDDLINALRDTLSIREKILHIPRAPAYAVGALEESVYRLLRSKKPPLLTRYAIAQMAYGHALDISKIKRFLHYTPIWNYRRGFEQIKI
jgi:nucleoside-diphosphate-sugar epimerase